MTTVDKEPRSPIPMQGKLRLVTSLNASLFSLESPRFRVMAAANRAGSMGEPAGASLLKDRFIDPLGGCALPVYGLDIPSLGEEDGSEPLDGGTVDELEVGFDGRAGPEVTGTVTT